MPDAEIKKLRENDTFQERTWVVERAGWLVMAVLIVAALAGAFSRGPLSYAEATAPDGSFLARYERFMRHMTATDLTLDLQQTSSKEISIIIDTALAKVLSIQRINPQPLRSAATAQGVRFDFSTSASPARVVFDVKPSAIGAVSGNISVGDRAVHIPAFVYP